MDLRDQWGIVDHLFYILLTNKRQLLHAMYQRSYRGQWEKMMSLVFTGQGQKHTFSTQDRG